MRVTIIGAGNMGQAIARGMLRRKLLRPKYLTLCDPSIQRLKTLHKKLNVPINRNNAEGAENALYVILAVKPYQMRQVCEELSATITKTQVIISIAAGVRIAAIKKWLKRLSQPVVRVMPNTPAQIGQGVAGWTATSAVGREQRKVIQKILQCLGKEIYIPRENTLDAVTAMSGSGPAYVYYFIECLLRAGARIGLGKQTNVFVKQTFKGAFELLAATGKEPSILRKEVTSPGGTTEAALKVMHTKNFEGIIEKAVKAALRRARQLSKTYH